MHKIYVNSASNLIEIAFAGLLSTAESVEYVAEVRRVMVTQGIKANYKMLIDISSCPIQPQETIKVLAEHISSMPKAQRIAIVCGSSLAKMQMRRLFLQPYARIVNSTEEGMAWLKLGQEPISIQSGML